MQDGIGVKQKENICIRDYFYFVVQGFFVKNKQGRAKPRKRLKRSIAYMWFFKFIYNVFI